MLPYGRQCLDEDDIAAVVETLRSPLITTGPRVDQFERAVADDVGCNYAVAVSSGTAALHCAMHAIEIAPGDEVIVTPMTFAATANAVFYQGGTPVFADVNENTLLIDPRKVTERITTRTKAIVAVDYAGQPCEYHALRSIAEAHNLWLVADACHSLGGSYQGQPVGHLADLTVFSFHPVKHITTGEGGMITTDDEHLARRMKLFRNHGISADAHTRQARGSWYYEMTELGWNYRITDIQCALGLSQLKKLSRWIEKRQRIAAAYDEAFADISSVQPLARRQPLEHAYHLYVVKIDNRRDADARTKLFADLRAHNIAANVHYIPVHMHPYYRQVLGTGPGDCPVAEAAYEKIISLPMFPSMTVEDVDYVIDTVRESTARHAL
jgi:perosamine synthetase